MLCTLYSCIWFTHLFLIIIKNCQSGWNKSTAKVLHCLRSLVVPAKGAERKNPNTNLHLG